ncbi:MAG TPA: hypothetical protein VME66_13555 [Candidatus Acidoferrales bacterium]|nr:hypothetical protein [Candidatus Acidoferrales bacterium]
MGASYLIGILLYAWSTVSSGVRLPVRLPTGAARVTCIAIASVALCALFALQLAMVDQVARSLANRSPYGHDFPLPVIGAGYLYRADVDPLRACIVEIAAIVQSIALLAVAALLSIRMARDRAVDVIVIVTAVVLTVTAVSAPAMESADLYSYAGLARSAAPYEPTNIPFSGDAAIINRLWGVPLLPSPYGPLWLAISKAVITPAHDLGTQLIALRLLEVASLAACLLLLRALKVSRATLALIAINPAVYDLFIAEGHNDIMGVAFLLSATWARRYSAPLAIVLASAAGLIKLPFALLAMLVFVPETTLRRRLLLGAAPAVLTVAISALAGGIPYSQALHRVYQAYTATATPIDSLLQLALALLAVGSVLFTVLYRRFLPGAVWAFPALGHFALAQYLAWSFPYALAMREPPLWFFASLPVAVYLLNTDFSMTPLFVGLRVLLVIAPIAALVAIRFRYHRNAKALAR